MKKGLLRILLSVVFLLYVISIFAEWPQYRNDSAKTGYCSDCENSAINFSEKISLIIDDKPYGQPLVYDGSLPLAEKDQSGNIKKIYINDSQGILGMTRAIYDDSGTFSYNKRYYFLTDALGSVSNVTNDKGKLLQEYFYDPYGGTWNMTSDPVNNLRFVGRYGGYVDDDTGLTYFWHRWYDSKDGRWVSRDPIGVNGGINEYAYVKNASTMKTDIFGLLIDPGPQEQPTIPIKPTPIQPTKTNCDVPSCKDRFYNCIKDACDEYEGTENICKVIEVGCIVGCAALCKGQPFCTSKCMGACTLASGGCEISALLTLTARTSLCNLEAKKCK